MLKITGFGRGTVMFFLMVSLLLPSANAAKINSFDITPQSPIWMTYDQNEVHLNFFLNCSLNESDNTTHVWGVVTLPDGKQASISFQQNSDGIYQSSYTARSYGSYSISAFCQDSVGKDATTSNFVIKKPILDILTPSSGSLTDVYAGSILKINVKFRINDQFIDASYAPSFTAELKTSSTVIHLRISSATYDPSTKTWNIEAVTDTTTPPGVYSLQVKGSVIVDDANRIAVATAFDAVRVNDPLIVALINPNPASKLRLADTADTNITVQVLEKGSPCTKLTSNNFEVYIKGNGINQKIPITDFWYDASSQRYILEVEIPKLPSSEKPYELYVKVIYNGYSPATSESIPVYFVIPISGQLVDPAGNIISATIKIRGEKIVETVVRTDNLGKYQTSLPAGTYEFDMRFPGLTAVIKGVKISGPVINGIHYDEFTKGVDIDGFKVTKLVVLEFAPPFKTAYLTIPYNEMLVRNERNLEVYRCTDWNFGRRECVGDWVKVDSTVNFVSNVVKVNTTQLGAFVVGERIPLVIELNDMKKDYYAEESVTISGVVKDADGNPVKNVNVTASIAGTKINGSATTDIGGKFSIVLKAPLADGSFEIKVKAEKNPYIPFEKSIIIHVQKKVEMKAFAPDIVSIRPGENKEVDITLQNTGQVDITNIGIEVTGIKYDWYAVVPSSINILKAGESKTVKLYINIPAEDCMQKKCEEYYFPKIKFSGREASDTVAFTLKLEEESEENTTVKSISATQKGGGFSFKVPSLNGVSGYFTLEGADKTNFYLSIFFLFLIFLAAISKKKKKHRSSSRIVPLKRKFI